MPSQSSAAGPAAIAAGVDALNARVEHTAARPKDIVNHRRAELRGVRMTSAAVVFTQDRPLGFGVDCVRRNLFPVPSGVGDTVWNGLAEHMSGP